MERSFKKWFDRGQLTMCCRDRTEKFYERRRLIYTKAVFYAILR